MLSRRQFVGLSVFVIARSAINRHGGTPHVLRVGTIVDSAQDALASGFAFGAEEAARTASMVGWRVESVALTPDNYAQRLGDVDVLVVGTSIGDSVDRLIVRCVADPAATTARGLTIVPREATVANVMRAVPDSLRRAGAEYHVEVWHPSLERFGAQQLNARYRSRMRKPMTSDAWAGWVSMKILSESAMRAGSTDPPTLDAYVRGRATQFDGHKGSPLWFDATGELRQPLYIVRRDPGGAQWILDREIPAPLRPS